MEQEKVEAENKILLDEFKNYLEQKGLGKSTINRHVGSIDFYINNYLLYYEVTPAQDGALEVDGFLGDWFIRKAAWSSGAHVKSNISSFKKFYTFLLEKGKIDKEVLAEMKTMIKEKQAAWVKQADNW